MNDTIKLILAEDEPAILRGLTATIKQIPGNFEVVDTASNGMEALEKIELHQPHIVITDIHMPFMNGLELIEKAKLINPNIYFIILTGHAEFSYAQQAMRLQIYNYLLKPIDPDILEELLCQLSVEITTSTQLSYYRYLKQNLYKDSERYIDFNPLKGYSLYLLFSFYGSITTNLYNELTYQSQIVRESHDDFLPLLSEKYKVNILSFTGNYNNEKIFAIFAPKLEYPIVNACATDIHNSLLTSNIFINTILSEEITDAEDISTHVRNCYLYSISSIIFGENNFFSLQTKPCSNHKIMVDEKIKTLADSLSPSMELSALETLCTTLIDTWKGMHAIQFQLQIDLRYVIDTALHKNTGYNGPIPDPSEIVVSSNNYEELYQNIVLELEKLFDIHSPFMDKSNHTKNLALSVRNYLDENYTTTITYKDFCDIFGYNEKYISLVFKEAYQISPSKYITQLRLATAKKLMQQNPSILLRDVAQAVGYDDQLYFSRVFKNSEGISPKAYQKSLS